MHTSNLRAAKAANTNHALSWYDSWILPANLAVATDKIENTTTRPPEPETKKAIREQDISNLLEYIGSDYWEGRSPGTDKAKEFTEWLAKAFAKRGLKPGGSDGSYFEPMSAVSVEADRNKSSFVFNAGGKELKPKLGDDMIFWVPPNGDSNVKLSNLNVAAVGYGITSKENNWDDYKNVDVKGKVALIFAGKPPGEDALTPYSRTLYKMKEAARHGAVGAIIIYDQKALNGTPWKTIANSYGNKRIMRDTPELNKQNAASIQGYVQEDFGRELLKQSGYDYDKMKEDAKEKGGFKGYVLNNQTFAADAYADIKKFETANVVGILEGTDPKLKNQYTMFEGHWDHLGRDHYAKPGEDSIFNGAVDNGTGITMMLELAEKFNKNRPKGSLLFGAWTSEEAGLLGSEDYAEKLNAGKLPIKSYQIKGGVNIDEDIPHLKGKDLAVVGFGVPDNESDLMPILAKYLKEQKRGMKPDPKPEENYYQRSDHFNFVKLSGIPMLMPLGTVGDGILDAYEDPKTGQYHQKSDEWNPNWMKEGKMAGLAEDTELFYNWARDLTMDGKLPQWNPNSPYKKIRDESLAKRPIS